MLYTFLNLAFSIITTEEKIIQLLKEAGFLKDQEKVFMQEQMILSKDHVSFVYERRASISKVVSENDVRRIKSFKGHDILIAELLIGDRVCLMMSDPEVKQLITLINIS